MPPKPVPSLERTADLQAKCIALEASCDGIPMPLTPNEKHIVIDTVASITIINNKMDFVSAVHRVQSAQLHGIASGLNIESIGTVCHKFMTDSGEEIDVTMESALYVPACSIRLLCPGHLAASTNFPTDGSNSLQDKGILTCYSNPIPYHPSTSLPILFTASGITEYTEYCNATSLLTVLPTLSSNLSPLLPGQFKQILTPNQQMKLMLHTRYNHKNWNAINS